MADGGYSGRAGFRSLAVRGAYVWGTAHEAYSMAEPGESVWSLVLALEAERQRT